MRCKQGQNGYDNATKLYSKDINHLNNLDDNGLEAIIKCSKAIQ